ncbi:MAG: radical SAM protein [Desulfovibrio sp.]|nr:radical SAM protein [Desulfovibrio sp.]
MRRAVIPIFLPFQGCAVRCVFCAQDIQTGHRGSAIMGLLAAARQTLHQRAKRQESPAELAFYGGTFTALPEEELTACLSMAAEALDRGWISAFRCSTRPDRLNAAILHRLRSAGCDTVELGIQSFARTALTASRRGYGPTCARDACALVRNADLHLGVQLLPGMPGHTPPMFLDDVAQALEAGAHMLRFYPCLVLEGTQLAALWRAGRYTPWPLKRTLNTLAHGWLAANAANVPVIRMGLAPQSGLQQAILDGPVDPALGSRVMGRGLLLAARRALKHCHGLGQTFDLFLPEAAQGCLWGHKGELRKAWIALGLRAVHYGKEEMPAIGTISPSAILQQP